MNSIARLNKIYREMKERRARLRYVPLDLSSKEDRDKLRGRWISDVDDHCGIEAQIVEFTKYGDTWTPYINCIDYMITGNLLFEKFKFIDGPYAGQPVGKMVEEA